MSASPNNPVSGSLNPTQLAARGKFCSNFPASDHRDLETLLALSSLHEQIRRRRAQELSKGARLSSADGWKLKQLVHDEVLQLIADRALTVTGADGVAVAIVDGTGIVCRASAGKIAPERGARLDPHSGFSGACLRRGEIVRCDDSEKDNRVNPQACQRLGTRSMVAVPLSTPQAIVGILEAFSTEPHGFNDSDVRCLSLLATLILDAMNPEEEGALVEISQRVVGSTAIATSATTSATEITAESSRNEFNKPAERIELSPAKPHDEDISDHHEVLNQTQKQSAKLVFFSDLEQPDNPRPGLKLVLLLVALAIAAGIGLWWQIRHNSHNNPKLKASAVTNNVAPGASMQPPQHSSSASDNAISRSEPDGNAPVTSQEKTLHPQVTGVRHWSSADSSTVVIDLEDQVQYEAHRLTGPERIYFDLLDTTLAHELLGKTIEVNDPLLQRIRIAQPKQDVTRVVLDTKGASNYSVSLEPSPYRLVVEVGKLGSKLGPKAKVDLFGPDNPIEANLTGTTPFAGRIESPTAENRTALAKPTASSQPPSKTTRSNELANRGPSLSIVLDAGHGGWDLGTVGRRGLLEKDLVLDIVQRLGNLLQQRLNAKVIYTRQGDSYVGLEKRAEIANLSQAKLFISVHANYSDYASARGVETYYTNTYSSVRARPAEANEELAIQNIDWTRVDIREKAQESRRFAEYVQQALYGTIAARNPGIRDRGVKEAQYVVLTGTSMPAILAEVSFVSSPMDENELQSEAYRQRIAEALYKGIAKYHETSSRHTTIAGLLGKSTAR